MLGTDIPRFPVSVRVTKDQRLENVRNPHEIVAKILPGHHGPNSRVAQVSLFPVFLLVSWDSITVPFIDRVSPRAYNVASVLPWR